MTVERAPAMAVRVAAACYAWIVRFARGEARDLRSADARATFLMVCAAAYRRAGLLGWSATVGRELAGVTWQVARSRMPGRRPSGSLSWLWRDGRQALKSLRTSTRVSAVAVVTLAVGIGVNAAAFSVLDAVLWRPMPFRDADRLVELASTLPQGITYRAMPASVIQGWREQRDLFARMEAYESQAFVLSTDAATQRVAGAVVTPGLFEMVGAPLVLGRSFAQYDGEAGTHVAIISQRFWTEQFARTTELDAVSLTLDGRAHLVIGVAASTFRFPSGDEVVWVARDLAASTSPRAVPFARLADGVSLEQAAEQVKGRAPALGIAHGGPPDVGAIVLRPSFTDADDRTSTALGVLAGAVGLVFLIVCANVASLTVSRTASRGRDLATHQALGATRGAVMRIVFLEQVFLALVSAALGGIVAALSLRLAAASLPAAITSSTLNAIDLDVRALLFLIGTGTAAGICAGAAAVLAVTGAPLTGGMGRQNRPVGGSPLARRLRAALIVGEVATSVVLLFGAALITRSFVGLTTADSGYQPEGLVSLHLGLPAAGYAVAATRDRVAEDIATRIAALPGVEGVTVGGLPSEAAVIAHGPLEISGQPVTAEPITVPIHEVSASYFTVMGLPLREGRGFSPTSSADEVIVNQRFAARYFPEGGAVGQQFRVGKAGWRRIVGVAADTLGDRERGSRRMEFFYPLGAATDGLRAGRRTTAIADFCTLMIRSRTPAAVAPLLSGAVRDRDPSIVVWRVALVEDVLAESIARPAAVFLVVSTFAIVGLALSVVGLYSVLVHLVSQRRTEIGVRLALGASTREVRMMVMRSGVALVAGGLVLGAAAGWPLHRLLESALIDVAVVDPLAAGVTALLVVVTGILACWWPARDAGRIDPVALLRGD